MKAPKEMVNLKMPAGQPEDGKQNETEGETNEQEAAEQQEGTEGNIKQEAQELYDEIMEDDPKLCRALYDLLKDKYENEDKTTKKEVASEKGGEDTEYNTEGMES